MKSQCLSFQPLCIVIFVLLVFLSGCGVPVAATPVFSTATPPPPTNALPLSFVPPTYTPSPTATPEPPIPTVAQTPTMAPTLTTDQEQALVSDLLQNNAGCRLPCWWGFTPGKTAWQTAQSFFASLGKATDGYGSPYITYSIQFNVSKHDTQIDQIYSVINDSIDMVWVRAGTVRNRERIYGEPLFAQDLQRYLLPQLLTTYGQPTKVFLETYSSVPERGDIPPFRLLLFYPRQGILAKYQGLNEREGEQIRVCPKQAEIALWLWSPESRLTFEDVARANLGDLTLEEVPHYRLLEQVTGMSLERFYETFKDADNHVCLETPADLWP